MIIIVSDRFEEVIDKVTEILMQFKKNCIRISSTTFLRNIVIDYEVGNKTKYLYYLIDGNREKVEAIWLKNIYFPYFVKSKNVEVKNQKYLNQFISQIENERDELLTNLLLNTNLKTRILSNYKNRFLSKIEILHYCFEIGLKTPKTYLVNNKFSLKSLLSKHQCILKNSWENFVFDKGKTKYFQQVELINENDLCSYPEHFFPISIQEYIPRIFEVRVVYFRNTFYPMAVYTMENHIDIRYYNGLKRKFRYNLPKNIEKKLIRLLKKFEIELAAIDMIVTPDGEIFFLEVNPNGNISNTLLNCNYDFDYKLAEYLSQ